MNCDVNLELRKKKKKRGKCEFGNCEVPSSLLRYIHRCTSSALAWSKAKVASLSLKMLLEGGSDWEDDDDVAKR